MLLSAGSRLARKRDFTPEFVPLTADGVQATVDLDFVNNLGVYQGAILDPVSRVALTRASIGYAQENNGNWLLFPSGAPRRTNQGLLIEEARTNLFLNSYSTPSTQSITVLPSGQSYTVSIIGTGGLLTLSGAATGTVTPSAPLTVATTTATLTVTVTSAITGTFKNVQVELGTFATSPILNDGSTNTRAADVATVSPFPTLGSSYSIFGHGVPLHGAPATGTYVLVSMDDGTVSNRIILYSGNAAPVQQVQAGGSPAFTTSLGGTFQNNTPLKGAVAYTLGNQSSAINGAIPATGVSVLVPAAFTTAGIGCHGGTFIFNGYIRRVAYWMNNRISNSAMQQFTKL